MEGGEAGLQAEVEAAKEKLATAQREAEELSTSLAKASSLIEVNCPIPCQLLNPLPGTAELVPQKTLCMPGGHLAGEVRCSKL